MTKREINEALERSGLNNHRTLPPAEPGQTSGWKRNPFLPSVELFVPSGIIATRRHGIVWQGDLDIQKEDYLLNQVARKTGENLYVLDSAGGQGKRLGASRELIKEALWWTQISNTDEDTFLTARDYQCWREKSWQPGKASLIPPGKRWESKVLWADEAPESLSRTVEVSDNNCRAVSPVLLQRSGPYELVWFSHGQAMHLSVFHQLLSKDSEVRCYVDGDTQPIYARHDQTPVALIWPCPVPNPQTVSAARHEMAMTSQPPNDPERLKLIVSQQLQPAIAKGALELRLAVDRLLSWLRGQMWGRYYLSMMGVTEWTKSGEVELTDLTYMFKDTMVPLSDLFSTLFNGDTTADFLAENPTVTKAQVDGVLQHAVLTICS